MPVLNKNSAKLLSQPKRTGARKTSEIPTSILEQLNKGEIETANLVEWLAVDQAILLNHLLTQHHRAAYLKPILNEINQLKKRTVNTINEAIGTGILKQITQQNDAAFFQTISLHPADLIRCWAAYTVGKNKDLSITEALKQIQPFAADPHFGVREISWLAIREKICNNLEASISILTEWATNSDENIRRFASEAIRPRGVWSAHIDALKQNPAIALSILEALKSDPSRYVQNSVANWLNDAAKTCPLFVSEICAKWEKESSSKETRYIVKRAVRNLNLDDR
ncbi:MAG: DNA alkylation repair protein [Sphingobacterium sp.]